MLKIKRILGKWGQIFQKIIRGRIVESPIEKFRRLTRARSFRKTAPLFLLSFSSYFFPTLRFLPAPSRSLSSFLFDFSSRPPKLSPDSNSFLFEFKIFFLNLFCFPVVQKWMSIEPMTTLRSRVGVSVMHRKLYAIGGFNGHERLRTVEVFEPEQKKWREIAALNMKRSALGAAVVNDKLYVCGG